MNNNNQPLVSIAATSYNFERFIPYFMESVLSQTYNNWELIVTDDFSTDKSLEILRSYEKKDSRIKIFQNDKNRHTSYTLNNSLKKATGEYICIMSCDDGLFPEKIAHDVEFMNEKQDVGVLYGKLNQIDENSFFLGVYNYVPPRNFDKFNLLRKMYLSGNNCPSPGMFFRKNILDFVGFFNPLLRITHDYDYHTRLFFSVKPAYNKNALVNYRRLSDNTNLSNISVSATNSEYNETFFILNNYLDRIRDYSLLKKIFPSVVEFGPADDKLIPYYLGRIAITSKHNHVRAFGIQAIYNFMLKDNNVKYLEDKINFLPKDFMNIVSNCTIYNADKFENVNCIEKMARRLAHKIIKLFHARK